MQGTPVNSPGSTCTALAFFKPCIKFLLGFCFAFTSCLSFSQKSKVDSLLTLLNSAKADTNKIDHLLSLADVYTYHNHDSAIFFAAQAKNISELIKDKKRLADALFELGWNNYQKSAYATSLNYHLKALEINEELGDKKGIASNLCNIGIVYQGQANYPKALDHYFKSLKIDEEIGDKNGVAVNLGNIGGIYYAQADYAKASDYFSRALKISEESGDKGKIALWLGNLGIVHQSHADYAKALDYYLRALKMDEALNNKNGVARHLSNVGLVYSDQARLMRQECECTDDGGNYAKALDYCFRALKINEELGHKLGIAIGLENISHIYIATGKFKEAGEHLQKALTISDSIGALSLQKSHHKLISFLYDTLAALPSTPVHKKEELLRFALNHYKKYIAARDSINSEEQQKTQVRVEMNFEFEKKEAMAKAGYDKQLALAEAEKKQQQAVTWSVAGGLLLVLLFAGLILRSLRITKKQKNIIERQKDEVTRQKEIVEEQKHLVEEHQKEITDSIKYARRLQQAILPPTEFIKKHLPDSFVLYKPKDIVAGDFYWMEVMEAAAGSRQEKDPANGQLVFLAAADCTGHGVPGAMVSVVCSNALNRAVKEFGITAPGKILDKVRELVIETFEKSESEVKDGMDISLCALNTHTGELAWAGANNPLWIIHEGELQEIKPDKQPIGKYTENKPFTTHGMRLEKDAALYLFTDGFSDQFGGKSGKKFKSANLKKLLLSVQHEPMQQQQEIISGAFEGWKGSLEQVDDVCVIGVRW